MSMCQGNSDDIMKAISDVREIRKDKVDSGLTLLWEENAAINNQKFSGDFKDGHVTTDFSEASQRNNAQSLRS